MTHGSRGDEVGLASEHALRNVVVGHLAREQSEAKPAALEHQDVLEPSKFLRPGGNDSGCVATTTAERLMRRSTSAPLALALALAGLLTACIAEPYDGEIIAQNPTTIIPRLSGYGTALGQPVEIRARTSSGGFDVVHDSAVTTGYGWTWAGATWYSWQIDNFNLPAAYWTAKPGGCGYTATIRAKVGGYNGYSMNQEFANCWDPYQSREEFIDACVSDNSPDVTIETCGALCC